MNKRQEQQIVDYYSTTDRYIRSDRYSDSNQTVFTKENDRYQWLVLEQKSQHDVEVRQTDSHGTITTRDNYELTRNIPKCVGVERLCKDANMQIPFTADEINLIYQMHGTISPATAKNGLYSRVVHRILQVFKALLDRARISAGRATGMLSYDNLQAP